MLSKQEEWEMQQHKFGGGTLSQGGAPARSPTVRERLMSLRTRVDECVECAVAAGNSVFRGGVKPGEGSESLDRAPTPGPYSVGEELDILEKRIVELASRLSNLAASL